MNRITPEMVKEAYAKTGYRPERHTSHPDTGGCCAIGVMAYADDFHEMYSTPLGWASDKYGNDYMFGVIHGFDGEGERPFGRTPEYVAGLKDGRACALAVFGEQA